MPTFRSLAALALVLTGAVPALPLHAQGPEKGDYSFGIMLFTDDTGTVLNFGRQWTDRLHLGVELDLREASVEEDVTDVALGVDTKVARSDFAIGPVARWYGRAVGPVIPYLRARAVVGWGDQTFEQAGQQQYADDSFLVAASLAIGAEWFPMRQVALSGYTGLQVRREVRERVLNSGGSSEQTLFNSGTFRSALSIHFYFR